MNKMNYLIVLIILIFTAGCFGGKSDNTVNNESVNNTVNNTVDNSLEKYSNDRYCAQELRNEWAGTYTNGVPDCTGPELNDEK